MSILEEHELVLADPEPIVKLQTLNDSSVDFVVRPWCKTDDYWDVHWDVTREVKMRFDKHGVSIPRNLDCSAGIRIRLLQSFLPPSPAAPAGAATVVS
jgi:small-conductance mechanosensitive channel